MASEAYCTKDGLGTYVLPIAEEEWPRALRIIMYLSLLAWAFIGVAIIADVFMGAIEKVTSAKVLRHDKKTGKYYTYELWNPTVANLTLMALGSSAPEILLNVIDIFGKSFFLEGLGPATIVGSAAFNMLMILAICIIAIGNGEIRKIKEMSVYVCTAIWSVFAYLWLIVILMGITPNVVDIWEGVLTFLFFPILCIMAWLCDKGYIGAGTEDTGTNVADMTDEELAEASKEVRRQYGEELTPDQIARIITHLNWQRKCKRADYRVATIRSMFGGKRIKLSEAPKTVESQMSFLQTAKTKQVVPSNAKEEMVFSFGAAKYACMENVKTYTIPVLRTGSTAVPGWVKYRTLDGTGKEGKDYEKAENALMFNTGEAAANITLSVLDNKVTDGDREFYVELFEPKVKDDDYEAKLGTTNKATLVVIDNDDAGIISFANAVMSVNQKVKDYEVEIPISRRMGSNGKVTIKYRTEADSAQEGRDFEKTAGEVCFEDQQVEGCIKVCIKSKARWEKEDVFRIYLEEPTGGAKFDAETDGGADKDICTVKILAEEGSKEFLGSIKQQLHVSLDKSRVGHTQWRQQFVEALYVNGGGDDDDEEEAEPPSAMDWVMHIIAVPWKLLFAFCPPTHYCGGWLCFFVALLMIGAVTVMIGDVATLLGCCMCIPEEITAITFVALGTSLPDTFASKSAAQMDPYADAAVGNVTGSNSVNVFLGLGLPWMIAAIQWKISGANDKWNLQFQNDPDLDFLPTVNGMREAVFVVKAGKLGFSVAVFSICAIACIACLHVRRIMVGGELGGPPAAKWGSAGFLVFLWFLYIALSSWKALEGREGGSC